MNKEIFFYVFGGFLALIISVIAGIYIGNSFFTIFYRSIISIFLFEVSLFLAFLIMKKKVPEVYEKITNYETNIPSFSLPSFFKRKKKEHKEEEEKKETSEEETSETYEEDTLKQPEYQTSNPSEYIGEDYILVEDKMIKRDPKLIADAIRTILYQDEGK